MFSTFDNQVRRRTSARQAAFNIEEYGLCRTEWCTLIDEWIFSERDRAILKRKLLDGVTFEQLAEEQYMSTQGIQKIVYAGQRKLASVVKKQ